MAWSEDVPARFEAYGWHTQRVEDGNDVAAIEAAIETARADDRPSLIAVRTHIGFGSPNKQDSQKAHGVAARARRGPPDQGGLRLGPRPLVLRARTRRATASGRRSRPARRWSPTGRRASTRYARRLPGRAPRSSAAGSTGPAARRLGRRPQDLRDRHRGRDAERQPGRDPGARARGCRSCSAAPPTCPSRT